MSSNRVPSAPQESLGRQATLDLLDLIEANHVTWSERVLSITAERFERRLSEEVGRLRVDLIREIHDGRSETIKWMLAFWLGQFFAFAGLLAFMLRFTGRTP